MEAPRRRRRLVASTHDLLREARAVAYSRSQLAVPEEETRSLPMLPVSISVELPRQDAELRQHLLYKLGDPLWEAKPAASRFAWTVGLSEKEEKSIEEDFAKAVAPFRRFGQVVEKGLPPITNDMRVLLPVYVKRGHQVLRDELDLHLGSLGGLGNSMAAAVQSYATQVCRDLGLNTVWFNALLRHMGTLFSEVNEDIKATGTSELLVTPGSDGRLRARPRHLPRLEEISAELEAEERERARRRDEKLILRQKHKKEALARAHAESQARAQAEQPSAQVKTEVKRELKTELA